MTREELAAIVMGALHEVAPECDPSTVSPDVNLRDQLDLDSMDFQSFIIRVHEALKIDVPEVDYPKFTTLRGATDYLAKRLGAERD